MKLSTNTDPPRKTNSPMWKTLHFYRNVWGKLWGLHILCERLHLQLGACAPSQPLLAFMAKPPSLRVMPWSIFGSPQKNVIFCWLLWLYIYISLIVKKKLKDYFFYFSKVGDHTSPSAPAAPSHFLGVTGVAVFTNMERVAGTSQV